MFFNFKKDKVRTFVITRDDIIKTGFLMMAFLFVFDASGTFLEKKAQEVNATTSSTAYLAIVIDDFGYNGEGTDDMLSLDVPITCALMPFSEKSSGEAEKIIASGKEMIVHMPMESLTGKKSWVGDKGVFTTMTDEEINATVNEAFNIAEGAIGLNNHMGSAIMEDDRSLRVVMENVASRGLIFLDSKTTPNSQAKKIGEELNSYVLERAVFLDSTDDINVVKTQLKKSAEYALKNGYAVAIGHVGPEGGNITVEAIDALKDEIRGMGVEFVYLSQIKGIVYGN